MHVSTCFNNQILEFRILLEQILHTKDVSSTGSRRFADCSFVNIRLRQVEIAAMVTAQL